MTDPKIEDVIERLKRSQSIVGDLCKEGRCPKMSIPANERDDEDLIMDALATP